MGGRADGGDPGSRANWNLDVPNIGRESHSAIHQRPYLQMKIAILTYGSRGDVQPYLALALGLQKAGHTIRLAAPHRFADLAAQIGSIVASRENVTVRFSKVGRLSDR